MNKTICAFAILLAGCIAAAAQNLMQSQKGITVSKAPPEVVKELAPTGKLRVALNLGNIVLVQAESPTAEARGVSPDLARELASRLGVPVEFTRFDGAGKAFDAFKCGALDIIFLAIEPVRAAEVAFTALRAHRGRLHGAKDSS
jgi:polar amino acid transport system substrate-binding protein